MNSSVQQKTNIIIDSSIITLSSTNICISTGMFAFIVYHLIKRRNSPHRIAFLLTANMYFALLFWCILMLKQYMRVSPVHLYLLISLDDGIGCKIRAYFQWVALSAICYSNTLQSVYRLCRVVFYNKRSLQSLQFYIILIIIQWIVCFLIMIPAFLLNAFKYLADDYLCQIDYLNVRSTLINGTLAYAIPMYTTIGCYIYTMKKMRRGNNSLIHTMTRMQQIIARRDLVVLFRICILVGFLMIICVPSIISLLIYKSTGYLPWWSVQIQRMVLILSIINVTITLTLVSRHVWNLLKQSFCHHYHPTVAPAIIKVN